MNPWILTLIDTEATEKLGLALGRALQPGALIALIGTLGAGKTFISGGIAEGLGVADRRSVTSPTFVLQQEYHGRLTIYHFDVYRLRNIGEFLELGFEEILQWGDAVCIIEWADKIEPILPDDRLSVQLTVIGDDQRQAILSATGPRHQAMLDEAQRNY